MAPNQSIALFVAKNSHTWPKIVCCPLCDNHFNCWTHHNISLVRAISAQGSFFSENIYLTSLWDSVWIRK